MEKLYVSVLLGKRVIILGMSALHFMAALLWRHCMGNT